MTWWSRQAEHGSLFPIGWQVSLQIFIFTQPMKHLETWWEMANGSPVPFRFFLKCLHYFLRIALKVSKTLWTFPKWTPMSNRHWLKGLKKPVGASCPKYDVCVYCALCSRVKQEFLSTCVQIRPCRRFKVTCREQKKIYEIIIIFPRPMKENMYFILV